MSTIRQSSRATRSRFPCLLGAGLLTLGGWFPSILPATSISEPDTLLYGRILNRSGSAEQVVTAGTLTWTFQVPGSGPRTFSTELEPLQGGAYSYRLRLPHSLVGTGLQNSSSVLPLGVDETTYGFGEILVDGARAVVKSDQLPGILANQERRAQALRVDLEIRQPMIDTDGDGMPDWWETANGLDPLAGGDAGTDADGDGLGNLAEWNAGSSPNQDNRVPSVAWVDLSVYPTGVSGLALRVVDTDTAAEAIALVVTQEPEEGEVVLRSGTVGRLLRKGDVFTAAEAHAGLLQFRRSVSDPPSRLSVALGLAIVDQIGGAGSPLAPGWQFNEETFFTGQGGTVPVVQEVRLRFVADDIPGAGASDQNLADSVTIIPGMDGSSALRAKASFFARYGRAVVWDLLDHPAGAAVRAASGSSTQQEYAAGDERLYGPEMPVFILGGSGNDRLEGGFGADILCSGGGDDLVIGNRGGDRFIVGKGGLRTRLVDFNPEEGDQLDLSRVFAGKSGYADDFIEITAQPAGGSILRVFATSGRVGDPEAVVQFNQFVLSADTFPALSASGAILLGSLNAIPLLTISSAESGSENGLMPARFIIRRIGGLDSALSVQLTFSGSATAGVDYQMPSATLVLIAGQSEVDLLIRPYGDGLSESDETVRVSIAEGPGYRVAGNAAAELVISDLLPEFHLTQIQPEASFEPWSPATIKITRTGLIDRQVVLEMQWSGSEAVGWVDPLPQFQDFGRGETTRFIEVRPKAGTAKPTQPLVLMVRLAEDSSYRLGESSWARVVVIPRDMEFGEWVSAGFSGNQALMDLALSDPDRAGLTLLERFAFSLTPRQPNRGSSVLPAVVQRNGRYGVEFVLRPGARGVGVDVQTSPDLNLWTGGSSVVTEVLPAPTANFPAGWRRYEPRGPNPSALRYFRVRLTFAP